MKSRTGRLAMLGGIDIQAQQRVALGKDADHLLVLSDHDAADRAADHELQHVAHRRAHVDRQRLARASM